MRLFKSLIDLFWICFCVRCRFQEGNIFDGERYCITKKMLGKYRNASWRLRSWEFHYQGGKTTSQKRVALVSLSPKRTRNPKMVEKHGGGFTRTSQLKKSMLNIQDLFKLLKYRLRNCPIPKFSKQIPFARPCYL